MIFLSGARRGDSLDPSVFVCVSLSVPGKQINHSFLCCCFFPFSSFPFFTPFFHSYFYFLSLSLSLFMNFTSPLSPCLIGRRKMKIFASSRLT